MPPIPASCDVVVLGAGPAGLAAAWYAVQRGHTVTVLDHAPHVGGLAGSTTVDGQSVDFGSHRLHASIDPALLDDLRRLGVELQWRPRRGRIRLQGRWLNFPLRPMDLVRHAPLGFAAHVVADAVAAPVRQRLAKRRTGEARSFADAARRGLGRTVTEAFYAPYARKLWAVDGDELSTELFRRRVSSGSTATIVRKVLRRGPPAGFWYPTRGFGSICITMADAVQSHGGTVATDAVVRSIVPVADRVRVTLADGRSIVTGSLIATIPSASLLEALAAPQAVRDAARRLEFRAAVLVYLTVPRPRYTPFDAHYFPESSTIVSRLSEPKHYRVSPFDPPERTVLCAEVPASPGDEIWSADDKALARRVAEEMVSMGLPEPHAASSRIERRTHVYPVYRIDHQTHQAVVDEWLDDIPDLLVVGRQATFAHDNTHHALLMGRAAASALDGDARIDVGRWREVRRAFADHVVED